MTASNTPKTRPRLGVVGLGYWGPNLARVSAESTFADLGWICDSDAERLAIQERRYPSASSTTDLNEMLDDSDLTAVLIATPVFTHAELVERALEAGKHVLVEKPLASSSSQARALLERAESSGRVLMCGHTFLYSPAVRAVKRLIDDDVLGDLHFISSSRVNLGLHQSDVSVVWDLGPHDFSILRYWLGEAPAAVSAFGRDSIIPGIHDVAFVNLGYESGLVANLEMSWLAPSKLRRTVIVGGRKMVVYEDGTPEPVKVFDHGVVLSDPQTYGEYQLTYRTGDILSPHIPNDEPLALQLRDFVESVDRGAAPPGHGDLCCDVVELLELADSSLNDRGVLLSST